MAEDSDATRAFRTNDGPSGKSDSYSGGDMCNSPESYPVSSDDGSNSPLSPKPSNGRGGHASRISHSYCHARRRHGHTATQSTAETEPTGSADENDGLERASTGDSGPLRMSPSTEALYNEEESTQQGTSTVVNRATGRPPVTAGISLDELDKARLSALLGGKTSFDANKSCLSTDPQGDPPTVPVFKGNRYPLGIGQSSFSIDEGYQTVSGVASDDKPAELHHRLRDSCHSLGRLIASEMRPMLSQSLKLPPSFESRLAGAFTEAISGPLHVSYKAHIASSINRQDPHLSVQGYYGSPYCLSSADGAKPTSLPFQFRGELLGMKGRGREIPDSSGTRAGPTSESGTVIARTGAISAEVDLSSDPALSEQEEGVDV